MLEHLPVHSPDINSIEWLWREIKRHRSNMWTNDIVGWIKIAVQDGIVSLPSPTNICFGGDMAQQSSGRIICSSR